jgi:hypothetical protein
MRTTPRKGIAYVMLDGNRQVCLYAITTPESKEFDVFNSSLLTWQKLEESAAR